MANINILPNNIGANAKVQPVTLLVPGLPASFAVGPVTLATVLDNLFRKASLSFAEFDLSTATDVVDGMMVTQRQRVVELIDEAMRIYFTDLIEVDGQIKTQKRGAAAIATLTDADLGAQIGSAPAPITRVHTIRKQDVDLPAHADLTYYSVNTNYEQATQPANRETVQDIQDPLTINTQLVLSDDTARQAVHRILYTLWLEKTTFQLAAMLQWLYLCPGDVLNVTVAGVLTRMRIITQDINLFGPCPLECALDETAVLSQAQSGQGGPVRIPPTTFSKDTTLIAWSSNALRDDDANTLGFYGVVNGTEGTVWNGAVLYISRDAGATYQKLIAASDPGAFGATSSTLPAPPANVVAGMFDNVSTVTLDLTAGVAPTSCSASELLSGVNSVLIGGEVLQFQTVVANGGSSYTLSNLIRGHRGTEVNWSGHGVGEVVVFLENNGSVFRFSVDQALFGQTVLLKAVTVGQVITAASPVSLTISGTEFTPYAGCSLNGVRAGGGDLTITWIRRTRTGGNWTDLVDADLGEATEAYSVDVMNGVTVVRTIASITPSVLYTAAQQTTDFGSPQSSVTVNVYQIGKYGRGYALKGTI